MLPRTRKLWMASLAVLIVLAVWFLVAALLPKSPFGRAAFYNLYQMAFWRANFLPYYSHILQQHGGYIPADIDAFLCARLATVPPAEFSAILSFYLTQSSGRVGDHLGQVPDEMKARIIGYLINGLDRFDLTTKLHAIALIERLRRDGRLNKPHLSGQGRWNEQNQFELVPATINQAAALYTDWWHYDPPWPAKMCITPLEGSPLSIDSL